MQYIAVLHVLPASLLSSESLPFALVLSYISIVEEVLLLSRMCIFARQ